MPAPSNKTLVPSLVRSKRPLRRPAGNALNPIDIPCAPVVQGWEHHLWDAWFLQPTRGVLTDGSKSVRRVHTRERERDEKAGFIMSIDSGVR